LDELIKGAEAISLFCRININTKHELPIRSSEMGLLICIVKEVGEHTPLRIAEYFKVTKPTVTAMIKSLVKKEYVTKVKSRVDKRSFIVKPTEKAVSIVNKTFNEYYKNMQTLQICLGNYEYSKLIELLTKANNILLEEKNNG